MKLVMISISMVAFFVIFNPSDALTCYGCVHAVGGGFNISNPDCDKNPKKVATVPCNSIRVGNQPTTVVAIPVLADAPNIKANKRMCVKGKGTIDNGRTTIVVRGCADGDSSFDTKCNRDRWDWRITAANGSYVWINGTTGQIETCACSKDKCNIGSGLKSLQILAALGLLASFAGSFI